ncbi:hypothetical protein [Paractinoplanes lichenicola]|uniref:Uncharacterized protein n=1 Tax=Paractinoplanes lichenicola TaxID=2802976 RepID=A0ABS1VW43_9ACTN|nr:hypothetical protein [Actinoplanes lichenicola]MBL7258707.1 hypothetical protein [Actinoplanes lichenicola]
MTDWLPPYVTTPPPRREEPVAEPPARGWQRTHTVAAAAAAAVLAATVGAAVISSPADGVTIVAARPAEPIPSSPSSTPSSSPPPSSSPSSPSSPARATRSVAPVAVPASRPARTTPSYVASPGELVRAQAEVTRAEKEYRRLRAAGATTADLLIARFEIEAAAQHLADLKAGNPHAGHRYLRILEAKAYLAKAEQEYRRAFADPTSSEADRQEAAAELTLWRERLAAAKRS